MKRTRHPAASTELGGLRRRPRPVEGWCFNAWLIHSGWKEGAAALLEAFDEDVLHAVLPQVRIRHIERFVPRPFVRRDETVRPPYRLHENLRSGAIACDADTDDGWTRVERDRNVGRVIGLR